MAALGIRSPGTDTTTIPLADGRTYHCPEEICKACETTGICSISCAKQRKYFPYFSLINPMETRYPKAFLYACNNA